MKIRMSFAAIIAAFSVGIFFAACDDNGSASIGFVSSAGGLGSSVTVIQGNISSQSAALRTRPASRFAALVEKFSFVQKAHAAVSGVFVSVRNTDVEAVTDDNGFFRIETELGGEIVLDFTLPNGTFSLTFEAPPGSTITLQDIVLNTDTGEAIPGGADIDETRDPEEEDDDDDDDDDNESASSSSGSSSSTSSRSSQGISTI